MKDTTSRFPDLVNTITDSCKAETSTFILDAEVIFTFQDPSLKKKKSLVEPYTCILNSKYCSLGCCCRQEKWWETFVISRTIFKGERKQIFLNRNR